MAESGGHSVYANVTVAPENVNGVIELYAWIPIPKNVTVLATGAGQVSAGPSAAKGDFSSRIVVLIPSKTYVNNTAEVRITGSASGNGLVQRGKADFELSISGSQRLRMNGTVEYSSEFNPEANTSKTIIRMYNAPLVIIMPSGMPGGMPGSPMAGNEIRLMIDFYSETLTNFSSLTAKTTTRLVVNARDQMTLLFVRNILAMIFMQANTTVPLPEPKYNNSRGMYYMEFETSTEQALGANTSINYDLLEQSSRIESFNADLSIIVKGLPVNESAYNITLSAKGGIEASLSGPLVVGNATIKKLDARARLNSNATHVYADAKIVFDMDIRDPYIAGSTVESIVKILSTAQHGLVRIVAPEPGALMVGDRVVHEAELSPGSASLGRIYYVYEGVVMNYYAEKEKRFIVLSGEGRVYARGAEHVVVDASRTGRATVFFEDEVREAKIYITEDGIVIVKPAKSSEGLRGTLIIQQLPGPPEPLPEGVEPLGPIVDVSLDSMPENGLMITLPYQKEPASGEVMVAHYKDGEWVLVKPKKVDASTKTVTIVLKELSPLTVVSYTEASTTETTTPPTTTTTTPTETTTTTTRETATTPSPSPSPTETTTRTTTQTPPATTTTTTTIQPSTTVTETTVGTVTEGTETITGTTKTTEATTTTTTVSPTERTTSSQATTTTASTTVVASTTHEATGVKTATQQSTLPLTTYKPPASKTREEGGIGLVPIVAITVVLVVAVLAIVLRKR
jgi:hypothetical protein